MLLTLAGLGLLAGMSVPGASAAGPTCSDVAFLGIEVHSQHIIRDYVTGGALAGWPPEPGEVGQAIAGSGAVVRGGPGPGFHFPNGFAPGASFCLSQANSPGSHEDPH
jgi:hypothetical protein